MKHSLEQSVRVDLPGFTAFLYNSKQDSPSLSAVLVKCHSHHDKVVVPNSTRAYFVISGEGLFQVGDHQYSVQPRDWIVVPPGVAYSYRGAMELFEVNTPATDSSDEMSVA